MDKISASCFSLHVDNTKTLDENAEQDGGISEIIVSTKSISGYESRKFKTLLPQILATAISGSFHIVVGISLAYSAVLIPKLEDPNSDIKVTKNEVAWIASIIVIIVPVGSIVGGFIMDSIGRLNTIKLAVIPVTIGWILIAQANSVTMILFGRVLTGLAAAWGTSPAIVYITEIARSDVRGSLISCAPAYASLGMVLAYLKGWFIDWRTIAWICNVYTFVPAILIMFIPESPVWLVSKGKIDQARKGLEWFYKYQPQPAEKQETIAEMQLGILIREHKKKQEENAALSGSDWSKKAKAFLKPTGWRPMLLLIILFTFQQYSGIYVTLFYAVNFFKDMGSDFDPYLASILIGTVRFCMSITNTYLLKRFNRRALVMTSAVGMTACMVMSGFFTLWLKEGTSNLTFLPVVFLLLYVLTSMIGMLPIPWTMTAEVFPLEIRGIAHSITYSMANFIMFLALQSYMPLKDAFGGSHGIQWFYGSVSIAGAVFVYFFLPETNNKKLSEITEYFETNLLYIGSKKKSKPVKAKRETKFKPIVRPADQAESVNLMSPQKA